MELLPSDTPGELDEEVELDYELVDDTARGGADYSRATADGTGLWYATAPDDYTAADGTLTFAAGETSRTVTVEIQDDDERDT